METKINFPRSNEKIWCKINEELEIMIPKVFTNRQMDKLSTTELSEKFDCWLHSFFLQRFGKKDSKVFNMSKRQKRPNKALEHLRLRKKQCKAQQEKLS